MTLAEIQQLSARMKAGGGSCEQGEQERLAQCDPQRLKAEVAGSMPARSITATACPCGFPPRPAQSAQ